MKALNGAGTCIQALIIKKVVTQKIHEDLHQEKNFLALAHNMAERQYAALPGAV